MRSVLQSNGVVVVNLDGVMGYPGSFLEEAFGGLIRVGGFSKAELEKHLELDVTEPHITIYREIALEYIDDAATKQRSSRAVA